MLTVSWAEQRKREMCFRCVIYIREEYSKKNPFPFKIQKSPFKIQSLSSLGSCENQMSKKERTRAQSQSDQSQPQWQEYNVLNVQCLGTTLSLLGSFKGLGSLLHSVLYSTQSLSSRLRLAPFHICCSCYLCLGTASPNAGVSQLGSTFTHSLSQTPRFQQCSPMPSLTCSPLSNFITSTTWVILSITSSAANLGIQLLCILREHSPDDFTSIMLVS